MPTVCRFASLSLIISHHQPHYTSSSSTSHDTQTQNHKYAKTQIHYRYAFAKLHINHISLSSPTVTWIHSANPLCERTSNFFLNERQFQFLCNLGGIMLQRGNELMAGWLDCRCSGEGALIDLDRRIIGCTLNIGQPPPVFTSSILSLNYRVWSCFTALLKVNHRFCACLKAVSEHPNNH